MVIRASRTNGMSGRVENVRNSLKFAPSHDYVIRLMKKSCWWHRFGDCHRIIRGQVGFAEQTEV